MDTMYLTLGVFLIATGFLMMVAELFVPSGGILAVLALAAMLIGITLVFQYDTTAGLVALVTAGLGVPAFAVGLIYLWPRTPLGRRLFLPESPQDDTMASVPSIAELDRMKGRVGRAISALRPAGVVDFDGKRIDALTEGMMVEPGHWVRCVDVQAGKVIVQPVERPNLGELETAVFT